MIKDEEELWLTLAELLRIAPDAVMYGHGLGSELSGLCALVARFRARGSVSHAVTRKASDRLYRAVQAYAKANPYCPTYRRVYLHKPYMWWDGVRRRLCLRFARECRGER